MSTGTESPSSSLAWRASASYTPWRPAGSKQQAGDRVGGWNALQGSQSGPLVWLLSPSRGQTGRSSPVAGASYSPLTTGAWLWLWHLAKPLQVLAPLLSAPILSHGCTSLQCDHTYKNQKEVLEVAVGARLYPEATRFKSRYTQLIENTVRWQKKIVMVPLGLWKTLSLNLLGWKKNADFGWLNYPINPCSRTD